MKRFLRKYSNLIRYRAFGRPFSSAETTKAKARREKEDFFKKYCQGKGLDIGFGGDPVVPSVQGWDWEHGDAQYLKGLVDESFDFVYSSHVLEHMVSPKTALHNWWRVLKVGGFLITYLSHRTTYEKKAQLPSKWNDDHKHFYLLDRDEGPDTYGILPLIARSLTDYEVIYCKECSEGHTIDDPDVHSDGEYSIEFVLRKLKPFRKSEKLF
ncbi:MAG: class I SAM-dependent methyltransferase [Candidatus Moranbacteria bacterium]|nr:class I SAM-dependent methyltransferase [Candidatus Moranbacteria bacterium]